MLLLGWIATAWTAPEPEPYETLPGRWYPDVYKAPQGEIGELEALGYVGGYEAGDGGGGVVRWDKARAWAGLSVYSSGHAAEAVLIGMDGQVLHRWAKPFHEAFPGLQSSDQRSTGAWRRVAVRPEDGHLLGIYEGLGLVHLDARSRVVWAVANRAHHDARWRPGGGVMVLTRIAHPGEGPRGHALLEDCVTELDATGREVRRVSVLKALAESPWADLLQRAPTDTGDLLHTNELFPLDDVHDGSGLTGPGKVLLSMRHLDALAVLDLDQGKLLWAATGTWSRQHDVEITPSGALMLFDNKGGPDGTSRVLQLEPWSLKPRWSFAGADGQRLDSFVLGSAQELPNGDVLVTESTRGRALEVTRGGDVVWEYRNPEHTGPDNAYVAAIFELVRVPPAVMPWLDAR